MADKERGRLYSIQMDGSDSVPFIIKKDKLLIGRGDSCEIRIYVDGVAHEHCIISFNDEGKGFVEPVNKCGPTYLNRELLERQVSLVDNDVITVVKRSFRFYYPSSSKFYVSSSKSTPTEEDMAKEFAADFDVEDVLLNPGKDKRVTFGPRLSPEEFDRNMPPASPLRKGSLPSDKLRARTPCSYKDNIKSQIKKNLFKNSPSVKLVKVDEQLSVGKELHTSSVGMKKWNASKGNVSENNQEGKLIQARPLFSEIVKKTVGNPPRNTVTGNAVQKYSPKRLAKKSFKIKDPRRNFYKSPKRPIHPRILAVGSTGHANSPETIVIYKKRISPNSKRNALSLAKKRKSLRLLHDSLKAIINSEVHSSESLDDGVNNQLSSEKNSVLGNAELNNKEDTLSWKENENTIPYDENYPKTISSGTSARKNVSNTPRRKSFISASVQKNIGSNSAKKSIDHNLARKSISSTAARKSVGNTSARKSVGNTSARKSVGNIPARKGVGNIPARKSSSNIPLRTMGNTPARKSVGNTSVKSISSTHARKSVVSTPARKSISNTPARKSISNTSTRKSIGSTPARKNAVSTPPRKTTDSISSRRKSEDVNTAESQNEVFDESEIETPIKESNKNETESSATSLVAAINNVVQIDENNIDKSLKDIQNVVQALSYPNVSTLGKECSSTDMCMNAVKKLALTISMINAFNMYNRIIDDVSAFPLSFPSTSFESSRDNMRRISRSAVNQNEEIDIARVTWFQDIMRNFFSNSISSNYNDTRRMLKTHENDLNSADSPPSVSRTKSKRSKIDSSSKISLEAIDNGYKPTTQRSSCSHGSPTSMNNEDNKTGHFDKFPVCNEYGKNSRSSFCHKSPKTSVSNKEIISAESEVQNSCTNELSFSNNLKLQNYEDATMNFSVDGLSNKKSNEAFPKTFFKYSRRHNIVDLISTSGKMTSSKQIKRKSVSAKMLRSKTFMPLKQVKIPLVAKTSAITSSKKLKLLKKEQKHRSNVLKKVNYTVSASHTKNLKSPSVLTKSLKVSLNRSSKSKTLHKQKLARVSQKLLQKAKSRKKRSSVQMNIRNTPPPKVLRKRNENRKSVLLKGKGLKSKKLDVPSKRQSHKRSCRNVSSSKIENTTKKSRNRSVTLNNETANFESEGMLAKNKALTEIEIEDSAKTKRSKRNLQKNTVESFNVKANEQQKTRKTRQGGRSTPVTSPVMVIEKARKKNTPVENDSEKEELPVIVHLADNEQIDKQHKTNKRSQTGKHACGAASTPKKNIRSLRGNTHAEKKETSVYEEKSYTEKEETVNKKEGNEQIDKQHKINKRSQRRKPAHGTISTPKKNIRSLRKKIHPRKEETPVNKEEGYAEKKETSMNKEEDNEHVDKQHKTNKRSQRGKLAHGTISTPKKNIRSLRKKIHAGRETPVSKEGYAEKKGSSINKEEDNEQIDKQHKTNKRSQRGKLAHGTISTPKKNIRSLRKKIHAGKEETPVNKEEGYAEKKETSMNKEEDNEQIVNQHKTHKRSQQKKRTSDATSTPKKNIRSLRKNMYTKNYAEESPVIVDAKAQKNKSEVKTQNKRKKSPEMTDFEIPPPSKRKRNLVPQIKKEVTPKDVDEVEQKKGRKKKIDEKVDKKSSKKVRMEDNNITKTPADSKRGKKDMLTNKPKKGRNMKESKNIEINTSPVQEAVRSLRSRK